MNDQTRPDAYRQSIVDEEQLRMLSLGYYLSSGMCLLFSLFGGMYMFMGLMLTTLFKSMPQASPNQAPPPEFGWIFFGVGAFIFCCMIILATMKLIVARKIKSRSSRTFCLIIAGISCLEIPYGTTLGVLTFVVLNRDSVQTLFSDPKGA